MTEEIRQLPFDQLRALHLEIGALLAERRTEALTALKQQAAILGFTPADFVAAKPVQKRKRRTRAEIEADNQM
jgi:hypothetical protein